jgi:hypothetical protein
MLAEGLFFVELVALLLVVYRDDIKAVKQQSNQLNKFITI